MEIFSKSIHNSLIARPSVYAESIFLRVIHFIGNGIESKMAQLLDKCYNIMDCPDEHMSGIVPPFTEETARAKVKAAQDAWNTRDPEVVAKAYTIDSDWRNRTEFFKGREAIKEFLTRKWAKELDYRLMKELWAYTTNHISVRFEYEWRDGDTGQWYRTHGNEHWEFNDDGLMRRRDMSANDVPIQESERRYRS